MDTCTICKLETTDSDWMTELEGVVMCCGCEYSILATKESARIFQKSIDEN